MDVLFTIAVLFIGFNPKLFPKQQGKANSITLAFIIIAHGLLHFFLGYIKDCASPPSTAPAPVLDIALYAAFIFALSLVAYSTTSSVKPVPSFFVSIGFTYLIVKASLHANPANVGTIFGGTQLLASVLGAFVPKNPPNAGTQKQGLSFIAPCAVSLWELMGCCDGSGKALFNKIGGHVWYDIALHTCLIVTQLTPLAKEQKKS